MQKGLLTYAKDFLFKGFFGANSVTLDGKIPATGLGFNDQVLKQGNYKSQLEANRGMVYACTDIRGIGVAKLPFRVYIARTGREKSAPRLVNTKAVTSKRKDYIISKANPGSSVYNAGDLLEVTSGPLVDLLRNVNDYQNAFDLKSLTVNSQDLTGDTYWVLIRNGFGTPVAIWIIPSEFMSPIPDETVFIKGYKYKRGTTEITYPKDDVVHFKKATLRSQYVGKAPLDAAAESVDLRLFMMRFEQQMFKTGGNFKGIISTEDSPPDKEQGERMKQQLKDVGDADYVLFTGTKMEVTTPPHITSRDMGYREGLALTRDEIAAIFHIPKSILTTDDVNLANAEIGEALLGKYAIEPLTMQYQEKVTEQLAWQFDPLFVTIFDDPVPENRVALLDEWKMMLEFGVMSPNEVRAEDGKEPREDGDEYAPIGGSSAGSSDDDDENELAERIAALSLVKVNEIRGRRLTA